MPFKHNAPRGQRIPKRKYRVTNWPEYEAGLRRRGSMTLWITPQTLAAWWAPRRKSRGGQPKYSDLAIETVLTLGCVFGLRLGQTEGLVRSVFDLMGLAHLPVPDHTTLSRRAQSWKPQFKSLPKEARHVIIDSTGLKIFGAGQWLEDRHEDRHGAKSRRSWAQTASGCGCR